MDIADEIKKLLYEANEMEKQCDHLDFQVKLKRSKAQKLQKTLDKASEIINGDQDSPQGRQIE